jgi:hypothetical protein
VKKTLTAILSFGFFLSACAIAANPLPTQTYLPPSETPSPSVTPEPTGTFAPLPTATPVPHPMSIIALRNQEYPGSEITVVKELDRGVAN